MGKLEFGIFDSFGPFEMKEFLCQVLWGVADRGNVQQPDLRDFRRRVGRGGARMQSQKSRRPERADAAQQASALRIDRSSSTHISFSAH